MISSLRSKSALRLFWAPVLGLIGLVGLCASGVGAEDDPPSDSSKTSFSAEQIEFFESHVRPVLVEHCYDCHSNDAKEVEAKLLMDTREGVMKGGESGPIVVPGKPDESELIAAVRYESTEMPPDGKLSQKDIDSLVKWVEMGAPWPEVTSSPGVAVIQDVNWDQADWDEIRQSHWAWQPIRSPKVPLSESSKGRKGAEDSSHPIDRFVEARRTETGLRGSERAEPRQLARRIYVDLIGIVPSPDQTEAFVRAASADHEHAYDQAITQLIDELLASPQYGQRWGRHWLDVARFSDGHGGFLDSDQNNEAWRYRDWVVDAINRDMPIHDFIRMQIAGDLIGDYRDAVATGFFALGPTYRSDGGDPDAVAQAKIETLDDRMDTLSRGLMGITASCSRCHDHKFDPIPQKDYYSLAGVFNNSGKHNLPQSDQKRVRQADEHRKAVQAFDKQIKEINQLAKKEKREQTEEENQRRKELEAEREELKKLSPPAIQTAHALRDTGNGDMHIAIRGNLRKTGDLAPRRFLRLLAGADPAKFSEGSGRLELANAVVDPANPLTARVFVNRIWRHHFGEGLVRTPSNFGTLGEPPTHPDLLDWLASDFVKHGWSLKRLHRQLMTTRVYQQKSDYRDDAFAADGGNRWLWRYSPRRMDVESWRDSVLFVTDELDVSDGGAPAPDITTSTRRTLYAKVSRNGDVFPSDRFLRRFDFPLMRATVAARPSSVVPQQFLFLLNSRFMVDRAARFSGRLQEEFSADRDRIVRAYQLLYSRDPDSAELKLGMEFVGNQPAETDKLAAWEQYAQVLLSSNEFMHVR